MDILKFFSRKLVGVLFSLILLIILVILIGYFFYPYVSFLTDVDKTREFVSNYGIFAPLVLILLHIIQVLLTPIPGQVVGLVSGYLFGWFFGTIYTMIGVTLGSFLAIFLARKFGRSFVERLTSKNHLQKFDGFMKDKGTFTIFLLFLLPAIPDDTICLLAGLTNIKIRTLVLLAFIGRLPGFLVLNFIGNGIAISDNFFSLILFLVILLFSIIAFIYRKKLERFFNKLFKFNF